jgi:putative ABC transport system ATP-binding protein
MQAGLNITNGTISLVDGDRSFRLQVDHLHLASGTAMALTGASGSGKTLMLELLGLLRAPGAGTVYGLTDESGADTDLARLWKRGPRDPGLAQARGRIFGFVPQTGGLLPFLSVAENIALPQRLNDCRDAGWCRHLIERLGLEDVSDLLPGALSIGQRQRTAIARSLSHRPPFVIADEPTAALDPESADTVLQLLLEVAGEQGSGIVLSSHDLDRIARFNIARVTLKTRAGVRGQVVSTLEAARC